MAQKINKVYDDAVASGLLPGVSLFAGDKDGNTTSNYPLSHSQKTNRPQET